MAAPLRQVMVDLAPLDRGEIRTFFPGHQFFRADDDIMDAPISVLHEGVRDVIDLAVAGMADRGSKTAQYTMHL